MDDDKKRATRNTNLLRMLERIDYQAATLAAKSEKLKLLKVGGTTWTINCRFFIFLFWHGKTVNFLQTTLIENTKNYLILAYYLL